MKKNHVLGLTIWKLSQDDGSILNFFIITIVIYIIFRLSIAPITTLKITLLSKIFREPIILPDYYL